MDSVLWAFISHTVFRYSEGPAYCVKYILVLLRSSQGPRYSFVSTENMYMYENVKFI